MIILLNGAINAGKTTVARRLCALLPRTAHVEVDDLRHFITWMLLRESIPISLACAAAVTRVYVEYGLHVVISYPLSEEDYALLRAELAPLAVPIHTFTLAPRLEVALQNRGERSLRVEEKERIRYHYVHGLPSPSFGRIIDNSEQTPEETVRTILALLDEPDLERDRGS